MKQPLRLAGEPLPPPPGPAVLAMGFRPFFLLAAAFGAVVLPVWIVVFGGHLPPGGGLVPTWWHAHEMFIGYTGAVLAGFLLTAARHWSGGRHTAANGALAVLVLLWLAGRLAHAPGVPGGWWSPLPDAAWLLGTAIAIGRPLVAAGSRRNYGFLVALPALAGASVALHAVSDAPSLLRPALDVPLAVMTAVMVVVAGRIVPMFTRNALGVEPAPIAPVERALPWVLGAVVLAALAPAPPAAVGAIEGLAGALVLSRMAGWRSPATLRAPLLWILHLGHAFVGVGLLLLAASRFGHAPPSAGLHAITAGGIGCLTLGMMARVSLGHTGRPLQVGRSITVAFVLMAVAASARVVSALLGNPPGLLHSAGTAWALALILWLVVYTPIVLRPRVDGKPG